MGEPDGAAAPDAGHLDERRERHLPPVGFNSGNFLTSHTDPLGNQTTYGRDSAGNLTSITFPTVTNPASQSASIAITYSSKGQVTRYTNEEGSSTGGSRTWRSTRTTRRTG